MVFRHLSTPGEVGILCLTCFEVKTTIALLKWFPMLSNTQQPGLTGYAPLRQARKEQWCVPLVFLALAVRCRDGMPLKVIICMQPSTSGAHLGPRKTPAPHAHWQPAGRTQGALAAGTKYEFSPRCLAGSSPGQSAECGVCTSKHLLPRSPPGSLRPSPQ